MVIGMDDIFAPPRLSRAWGRGLLPGLSLRRTSWRDTVVDFRMMNSSICRTEYVLYRMDLQDLGRGGDHQMSVNVNLYSHPAACTVYNTPLTSTLYIYILSDPISPKPYPYPEVFIPYSFFISSPRLGKESYMTGGATKESGIPSNTQLSESKTSEKPASLINPPWSKFAGSIRLGSSSELSCCRATRLDAADILGFATVAVSVSMTAV